MLIYTMLQNGLLVVADTCKVIQESLESRIHDPDEPEKVLKVIGDPLDDAFDGFRYGVYSYQYPSSKPLQLRINEATAGELSKRTEMAATMAFLKQFGPRSVSSCLVDCQGSGITRTLFVMLGQMHMPTPLLWIAYFNCHLACLLGFGKSEHSLKDAEPVAHKEPDSEPK